MRHARLLMGPTFISTVLGAIACGAPMPTPDDDVGSAEIELTTVPAGVQCVRLSISVGNQTVSPSFTLAAGSSSATLNVGRLPVGQATFSGNAYDAACASVTNSVAPSWISDSVATSLSPGGTAQVTLTFRRNNPVTVGATFVDNIAEVTTGGATTYLRMTDGTIRKTGKEFGFSNADPGSTTAIPIAGVTNVAQIAPGFTVTCARTTDGAVWCRGLNNSGELGPNVPLGAVSTTPVQIPLPGPATDLAVGERHACAVVGQAVYCWGRGNEGQLGNGAFMNSATPVLASTSLPVSRVYVGYWETCGLARYGTPYCWGHNLNGQVGNGTMTNVATGQNVLDTSGRTVDGIVDMALGGFHVCALFGNGSVSCWGSQFGLGDGSTASRAFAAPVPGITDAVQVGAGIVASCVRHAGGVVSCWGDGFLLGDGGPDRFVPGLVPGLTGVRALRMRWGQHACVEMNDRSVRCWGDNAFGQLGDGTTQFAARPVNMLL